MAMAKAVRDRDVAQRLYAATAVVLVHMALYALLLPQPRPGPGPAEAENRLRISWVPRMPAAPAMPLPRQTAPTTPRAAPLRPSLAPRTEAATAPAPHARQTQAAAEPSTPLPAPAASGGGTPSGADSARLLQQARDWASQQGASDFAADPLRSRRAQLPAGGRPVARMREPLSAQKVVGFVGMLFGDPGSPCPRIDSRIQGLLTDTSEAGRELLQEEIRRERAYCRP